MDSTGELRNKIHDFVETADERILLVLNAIISAEQQGSPSAPESFYEEIDQRKAAHLHGITKSYTWDEVKNISRAALK